MTQYQGLLCENPWIQLEAVRTLNPATFLPITEGAPEHDCLEVLEEFYSSRPDRRDRPLRNADLESYPSLANQPSSGAKQGDVRFSFVSLAAYAPVASMPSTCLGIPSPAGGAPELITYLLEPGFLLQGGLSSPHWVRDRSMAPVITRLQPRHEQRAHATA
ncbi:hypothetical protein QTO34_004825, partial [Cnephaeus nilssonii]